MYKNERLSGKGTFVNEKMNVIISYVTGSGVSCHGNPIRQLEKKQRNRT